MKESQLKKEFDSKAVNRVRNLVKKDFTSKTTVGTGYSKKREKHSEGDIWEEDGRTWTIRNGVRQNITKLDKAKKTLQVPLTCPKCGGSMKHYLAKKMYKIHGFCFECTVDMEAKLRYAGLYEQYEKQMMQGNMEAWATGLEQWVHDQLEESMTFVTEEGDVEDWNGNLTKQKQELTKSMNEYLKHLREHLQ
jgi:bacterioferritin-associated ferredoxin